MSHQAVTWALCKAPMLRTEAGKPDSTSRLVLVALAQHASHDGYNAYPSEFTLSYETGLSIKSVSRALNRLEAAGLISRDGVVGNGVTEWFLDMSYERPAADIEALEAAHQAAKDYHSAYERKRCRGCRRVLCTCDTKDAESIGDAKSDNPKDTESWTKDRDDLGQGHKILGPRTENPCTKDTESSIRVLDQSLISQRSVNETASASDADALYVVPDLFEAPQFLAVTA